MQDPYHQFGCGLATIACEAGGDGTAPSGGDRHSSPARNLARREAVQPATTACSGRTDAPVEQPAALSTAAGPITMSTIAPACSARTRTGVPSDWQEISQGSRSPSVASKNTT